MADGTPRRIVHVDLDRPAPPPGEDGDPRPVLAVFWRGGVPVGQADTLRPPPELARAAPAGRDAAAGHAAPAPRVSVVVCTRDRPAELPRCLASLARLEPAPDEVIVVDNSPSGSARAVVDAFAGVAYVAEPRAGLSAARNAGVRAAAGDVVAFTDDDAEAHPAWVARLAAPFAGPEVMAVTGLVLPAALDTRAQVVFERVLGGFGRGFAPRRFGPGFLAPPDGGAAPVWDIGAGANMALRRRAIDLVGPFDERLGAGAAGCSEDTELWYRLLAGGWECRYEPGAVVFHHHRADMAGLRAQARAYLRGHVAALFVQYARHRHPGNLRRVAVTLPRHYAGLCARELVRHAAARAGLRMRHPSGVRFAEAGGFARGLRFAPYAVRAPRPRHKAPLGPFLARNPFPHGLTEGFFYREKMRAIHRVAPDRPLREVLEIGGGQSGLARLLYPGAHVTTADLDPAYEHAQANRGPNVRFVQADATALPFADASFDVVTLFDVLEHVPDDEAAAREALRVVRPGGSVLVSTPHARWRYPYHRALAPVCPSEEELFAEWGHVRRGYTQPQLERLFGAPAVATAGFIGRWTELNHDLAFSKLPGRVRRAACMAVSPLTWTGYWLHRPDAPGSEIAAAWRRPAR